MFATTVERTSVRSVTQTANTHILISNTVECGWVTSAHGEQSKRIWLNRSDERTRHTRIHSFSRKRKLPPTKSSNEKSNKWQQQKCLKNIRPANECILFTMPNESAEMQPPKTLDVNSRWMKNERKRRKFQLKNNIIATKDIKSGCFEHLRALDNEIIAHFDGVRCQKFFALESTQDSRRKNELQQNHCQLATNSKATT